MKINKIMGIITGIIGIILGITVLIVNVMDIDVPKSIWALFAVICLLNGIGIIINYKKNTK